MKVKLGPVQSIDGNGCFVRDILLEGLCYLEPQPSFDKELRWYSSPRWGAKFIVLTNFLCQVSLIGASR